MELWVGKRPETILEEMNIMKKQIMTNDEKDELIVITGNHEGDKKGVTYIHRNPSFKGVIIAGLVLLAIVAIAWIKSRA